MSMRVRALFSVCAVAMGAVRALLLLAALPTLAGSEGAALPEYLLRNLEMLVEAASVACDMLPLELLSSRRPSQLPPLDVVEVTPGGRRVLPAARAPRALRRWRPLASLPVYVPGWWNTPSDDAAQALTAALLKHHPVLLILDTRLSFCRGYLSAASRVSAVSHLLYHLIRELDEYGIPPSSVHLIGFSLGAHVAGLTGKLIQKELNTKVGKITALDPARPCFRRSEHRLRRSDARFVHVVHSSAGVLGVEEPAGHVDVYVNGVAVSQPECRRRGVSFECDHNQAWRLFAASVGERGALLGRRCLSWQELLAGSCRGDAADLGYGCSNHSRGVFLYKS